MSMGSHALANLSQAPDVVAELLHSLSQPLTSLRCSLEMSLELSRKEIGLPRQENVSAALQEAEKVVATIQLMREYFDAKQLGPQIQWSALGPTLQSVVGELASIAEVRGIQLCLIGNGTTLLPTPESRLRIALQYLIASILEVQPKGGRVMILLGENPYGAVVRGEGDRDDSVAKLRIGNEPASEATLMRRVRLAIASRVFEGAGASLLLTNASGHPTIEDAAGFVLRVPDHVPRAVR